MSDTQTVSKRAEVIVKAWADPAFRKNLVSKPKEVIAREFAVDLPDGLNVTVLEDNADAHNIVLVDPADLPAEERTGLKAAIVAKAWADPVFKAELLADPAAALAKAFGAEFRPGATIKAVEQTADQAYLVIPARPDGLADADLDKVAGGHIHPSSLWTICLPGEAGFAASIILNNPLVQNRLMKDPNYAKMDEAMGIAEGVIKKRAGHVLKHAAKKVFHGW